MPSFDGAYVLYRLKNVETEEMHGCMSYVRSVAATFGEICSSSMWFATKVSPMKYPAFFPLVLMVSIMALAHERFAITAKALGIAVEDGGADV